MGKTKLMFHSVTLSFMKHVHQQDYTQNWQLNYSMYSFTLIKMLKSSVLTVFWQKKTILGTIWLLTFNS